MRGRSGNHNERANKHNEDSYKPVRLPYFNHKKFTKANVHEQIISETSLSDTNEVDNTKIEADAESTLPANSTSTTSINSGGIRKLIPVSTKGKASFRNK